MSSMPRRPAVFMTFSGTNEQREQAGCGVSRSNTNGTHRLQDYRDDDNRPPSYIVSY